MQRKLCNFKQFKDAVRLFEFESKINKSKVSKFNYYVPNAVPTVFLKKCFTLIPLIAIFCGSLKNKYIKIKTMC